MTIRLIAVQLRMISSYKISFYLEPDSSRRVKMKVELDLLIMQL